MISTVYYIHKKTQPYCVTLFKKNDSVTLQDFKDNVKLEPSCKYRFFFKTQEPEFGYLKEEVFYINVYSKSYEWELLLSCIIIMKIILRIFKKNQRSYKIAQKKSKISFY